MPGSPDWWTPPEICDAARRVMGRIDLDPASCAKANEKFVKAAEFYSRENNGLVREWHGRVWMNPPFDRHNMQSFTNKLLLSMKVGQVEEAIVLVNVDPSTASFKKLAAWSNLIGFFRKRVRFIQGNPDRPGYMVQADGTQPRAQAVLGYSDNFDFDLRFIKEFADMCWFTRYVDWRVLMGLEITGSELYER